MTPSTVFFAKGIFATQQIIQEEPFVHYRCNYCQKSNFIASNYQFFIPLEVCKTILIWLNSKPIKITKKPSRMANLPQCVLNIAVYGKFCVALKADQPIRQICLLCCSNFNSIGKTAPLRNVQTKLPLPTFWINVLACILVN